MEASGAADSVAVWIVEKMGAKHAVMAVVAVVAACAGWQLSIVVAVFVAVAGHLWLSWMVRRALTVGEHVVVREDDPAGGADPASGGQSIAPPRLAPLCLGISSGALDSLPHNGYVVTTIRSICRESYSAAFPGVAAMTVIMPAIGAALAVVLFSL